MELTKGQLDGLMIAPTVDKEGRIVSLMLTVDTLPGLRVVLDGAAGREVRDALIAVYEGEPYAQGDDRTLPDKP